MPEINIVNVSGGVDSTACYLLALERGKPFRAVFADTGNEHEITLDYINSLARKTGGPEVQTVRADFRQRIGVRRARLEMMRDTGEYDEGWDAENVARVLENLHPTGKPMLDMCIWKGRFPSTTKRFCTVLLKLEAINRYATGPAIAEAISDGGAAYDVISRVAFAATRAPTEPTRRNGARTTWATVYTARWWSGARRNALTCLNATI